MPLSKAYHVSQKQRVNLRVVLEQKREDHSHRDFPVSRHYRPERLSRLFTAELEIFSVQQLSVMHTVVR